MGIQVRQGIVYQTLIHIFTLFALVNITSANAHTQSELPEGITVSISGADYVLQSEDIRLFIEYTNTNQDASTLSVAATALDQYVQDDFLTVTFEGRQISYDGPISFRRITDTQNVTLQPGQSQQAELIIGRFFDFSNSGIYEIGHRGSSASHAVFIEGRQRKLAKQPPNFSGCDEGERRKINDALGFAEAATARAASRLNSAPENLRPSSPRYNRWFGAYSSQNWAAVTRRFLKMADAVTNKTVTFNCSCDDVDSSNTYAYVFPNRAYAIYLCPSFFYRPTASGNASQAGIIIHEISHFSVVADTDDIRYGPKNSAELAKQSPSQAIRNADSFHYFAINPNGDPITTGASGSEQGNNSSGGEGGTPSSDPLAEPEPKVPNLSAIVDLLLSGSDNVERPASHTLLDPTFSPNFMGQYYAVFKLGDEPAVYFDQVNSTIEEPNSVTLYHYPDFEIVFQKIDDLTSVTNNWRIAARQIDGANNIITGRYFYDPSGSTDPMQISITHKNESCAQSNNQFEILELVYSGTTIVKMLANAKSTCLSDPSKSIKASFYYDSNRDSLF